MSKKSKFAKAIVFLSIVILAAILIILTLSKEPESEDLLILPVKTAYAENGDLEKLLRISGFIESETMVSIVPRISGTVTDLYLEMGDPVEKDQLLATIDSESYKLSFNQAKASFMAAESTFKRVSNLYATKSVSQQNYDEAKANYDTLKSIYDLAELNLSYTELKSPVKGVVLEKHVSKGSLVAPQVPVFTIGDLDNLKVKAGIPGIHYSFFQKHKEDMEIKITVPALENQIFRGSISNIAPFITPQTRNFIVKCQINEKKTSLRPGMFVYIDFVLEKRTNIFYLPYDVLTGGDSLWYVDENNRARSLTYSPVFGNDDYFQINSDIASNRFIIEGQSFLDDGQAVRVPGDL